MLNALRQLSRPSGRSSDPDPNASNNFQPDEAAIYKSLLLDLQYNQLQVSREYQGLFEEKEKEIAKLKAALGELSLSASNPNANASNPESAGAALTSSTKPAHSPAKPLRSVFCEMAHFLDAFHLSILFHLHLLFIFFSS